MSGWLELALDEVLVHAPECPTLLARQYLEQALRTVAGDAGLDSHTRRLMTRAGQAEYPVDAPAGRAVAGVLWVRLDGRVVAYRESGCGVRLLDAPDESGLELALEVQVAASGLLDAPQNLQDAVVNFALSRLLLVPQQRWSNPALAGSFLALYQAAKALLVADRAAMGRLQGGEDMPRMRGLRWV
ncbi:hypothetical protein VSS37_03720 [Candidatus Thiothrix sp. Deng01]|uniref:Uncharacterized protein n=1 Tax=Candidatus Thiothrix phosphatis TaxID=3112415 RepID=A0ABU6CTE8_9GAMM|nr:hypothetical protein [Candidatus Thiothrix sp. Deng01]MEB4590079.1 hypothetical protein [Candidatus Thiothrix sp. Deng01]